MPAGTQTLAIELSFDAVSEARLAAIWAQLESQYVKRGASDLGIRPHLSLAVFREGGPADLGGLVATLATKLRQFRLHFVRIAAFRTSEGVVFLEPVASAELLSAHRTLMELLGHEKSLVHAYYREGAWVPHCTVAIGVPEDKVDYVIDACRSAGAPNVVTACRVSAVQYRPTVELHASEVEADATRTGRPDFEL